MRLREGNECIVVGFYGEMMGLAHLLESVFKTMFDKPDGSSGQIRHNHGTLDLNELGGMVEVDSNKARDTLEDKVELEENSLNNSRLIFACGLD